MLTTRLSQTLGRRTCRRTVMLQPKPELERLEDRCLPSAASVLASLQDLNIQSLAQADYARDGSLTRPDMIGIFEEVVKEGKKLTAAEIADLNMLVDNSGTLGMTPDVANLAAKVVQYNEANTTFRGKALLSTGQLAAGQNASVLTDLVDKWFLGKDLPRAVDFWGETFSYTTAKGTLFGASGPSDLNVAQGEAGDCYFLAALGEIAARDPQAIRNMFIDNHDGTFTVRFFEQQGTAQVADYVTVNRSLPVTSSGRFIFANMGEKAGSSSNILWAALAEKAYAQLTPEGWSRVGMVWPFKNSYGSINGGSGGQVMQQVLGEPFSATYTHTPGAMSTMTADVAAGDLVTLASDYKEPRGSHVIADHEYYVTGYNAATKEFTIVNPWGPHWPKLHLTASQVIHYFGDFEMAAAPSA